jgi:hypothetical protein
MKGIEESHFIPLVVDCILLLKKIVTLDATAFAEYWIKPS